MTYTVVELDALQTSDWDAFVDTCDETSFFHRAGWKEVIQHSFFQTCYFYAALKDEQIVGVLPLVHVKSPVFGNRLVSTGFCVGGGLAVSDEGARAPLLDQAEKLLNSVAADYIELRDPAVQVDGWRTREGLYAGFEREIAADEDACLKQIPNKQRAVVRKAFRNDMDVNLDDDPDTFYDLYSMTMRKHGTPVFSRNYIHNLKRVFGQDCDIVTVSKDGIAMSSVLNFYFKDKVMPYYTGALPEARKLGAADLMYWSVMRKAIANGYKIFDFGRSKVDTGPYAFKKNWGFKPSPTVLQFRMKHGGDIPNVNPNNPKYKLMINCWKRLPLPLANMIGPYIGRQVG